MGPRKSGGTEQLDDYNLTLKELMDVHKDIKVRVSVRITHITTYKLYL